MTRTTWDGLPISPDPPFGATVVVFRQTVAGPELLLLPLQAAVQQIRGTW